MGPARSGGWGGPARGGTSLMADDVGISYANNWGGPFSSGALMAFADGSIRSIKYSVPNGSNTTLFGYMLRPNDGQVITID